MQRADYSRGYMVLLVVLSRTQSLLNMLPIFQDTVLSKVTPNTECEGMTFHIPSTIPITL